MQGSNQVKQLVALTVIGLGLLAITWLLTLWVDQATLNQWLALFDIHNSMHLMALCLLLMLLMAIGLPRQVVAFSLGYLVGSTSATLLATLVACGGCVLTYMGARTMFSQRISRRFPVQQQSLAEFFSTDTFQKALIIRLLPVGSNFLTNVIAGSVKAPAWPYLLGTGVGFVPQMTLFAMLGAGISVGKTDQVVVALCLMLVAAVLSFRLYRQSRKKLPTFQ
ncbi:TVP38/TMEM64 family protein [Thalassotalea fusca]